MNTPRLLSKVDFLVELTQRLDRQEVAFLFLLNSLRNSKKIGEDTFILEIPGELLNNMEKMILSRLDITKVISPAKEKKTEEGS